MRLTTNWPREEEAPTTITVSPFLSLTKCALWVVSSGKFIFIILFCGYPSLELPETVYDREGGTGGGSSF